MLRINDIKLPISHNSNDLKKKISKLLRTDDDFSYEIIRKSLDARKKPELFFIYCVDVSVINENKILKHADKKVTLINPPIYKFPYANTSNNNDRPIIIGMGPAGLFAGLYLARNGFNPIIFERGRDVDSRTKDVTSFFNGNELNESSNVQFGEGGAGTFSDGKLNTLIKEKSGRNRTVLKDFVYFGADENILYEAKPHVGTDVLVNVVKNIRNEIIRLGGQVYFESCITDFNVDNNVLKSIEINNSRTVNCKNVILAIGHSARDTFFKLKDKGMFIEPKPFAIGFRVSHNTKIINNYVYGKDYDNKLGNLSYKVTHNCKDGRGVYSFCMCPGGYVVNASSENGYIAINGMSYSKRDAEHSNSAIIITINPEDYMVNNDPMSGVYFQRKIEKKAYDLADGYIPVESFLEFKNKQIMDEIKINPCTKGEYKKAPVHEILPDDLNNDFIEGMCAFGNIIPNFDDDNTVVYGIESRTSSPIKMIRNEECMCNITNLFVSGEGAGYAGGIMSAAIDGIIVAEKVAKRIIS